MARVSMLSVSFAAAPGKASGVKGDAVALYVLLPLPSPAAVLVGFVPLPRSE